MGALLPLQELAARGMQPAGRIVWLGLDYDPPKQNAIRIDVGQLPNDDECATFAGLDVILLVRGFLTAYGPVQRLCGSILQARPRRFQLIDLDFKKIAFLKIGGCA